MYFPLQNRSGRQTREHLHSTNAVIVIINGEMDGTDHAANIQSHQSYQLYPAGDTNHIYRIECFRI